MVNLCNDSETSFDRSSKGGCSCHADLKQITISRAQLIKSTVPAIAVVELSTVDENRRGVTLCLAIKRTGQWFEYDPLG